MVAQRSVECPAFTVPSEPIPAGLERRVPCAAGYADRLDPGNPRAERLRLDVTAGRRLACRPGVYQRPRMAPPPDIRRRPSGRQGQSPGDGSGPDGTAARKGP